MGKLEAGWRQAAGGRLEAGWRQAGGRLEAGWRQAGGRSRKDLHLFGQTGGWLGAQKRCQGARPGAKALSFACKTNEILTILSWALAKRRYSSFNTLLVFGLANSTRIFNGTICHHGLHCQRFWWHSNCFTFSVRL